MTGPKSGTVYDAGLLRVGLELQLMGLVGASASAQLGLEVDYSGARGNNAGMRGKPTKRSEEHTSELQSLMRISYTVFCLKNQITYKAIRMIQHKYNKD